MSLAAESVSFILNLINPCLDWVVWVTPQPHEARPQPRLMSHVTWSPVSRGSSVSPSSLRSLVSAPYYPGVAGIWDGDTVRGPGSQPSLSLVTPSSVLRPETRARAANTNTCHITTLHLNTSHRQAKTQPLCRVCVNSHKKEEDVFKDLFSVYRHLYT